MESLKSLMQAATVKCPTCNGSEVASTELFSDTEGRRIIKVGVRMKCENLQCPRRHFSVVFNAYIARTTMEYEFPS